MYSDRFEPIDADSLNKKAKVLSVRSRNSFLGFSRAAVTQHHIQKQDIEEGKAKSDRQENGVRDWAAHIAKVFSF